MSVRPPALVLRIKGDNPHKKQMGEALGTVPGTLGFGPVKPTGSVVRARGFPSRVPSSWLQRAEGGFCGIMLQGYGLGGHGDHHQ